MKPYSFTHLHLHTEYSLLDGANNIKKLAKHLKLRNMKAVAMTDHGNLFGCLEFYQTMKEEGIKPIIGIETYIHNEDNLNDKSTKQRFHLCLYAKNMQGYKNLMYLSSKSYTEGFYYYPRINKRLLIERKDGLIASSACLQGEINWHLNLNNEKNVKFGAKGYKKAKEVALEYKKIFGDDFYLEIMRHGIKDQQFIDEQIIKISKEIDVKLIATNDTHYLRQDNGRAHEVFMCISMNKQLNDPNRLRHSVHEFYLKDTNEMEEIFADIPEAISNTQDIVRKCNLNLTFKKMQPPKFKFIDEYVSKSGEKFKDEQDYFIYLCKEGLDRILKNIKPSEHETYKKRLDREIDIITKMKFAGYMLIVWDFVREARSKKIPVGPGRGSAAGSLVSYTLGITNIDPIKYNLIFERFLNPERISMPDIDVDFCQARRSDIIDYVTKKYGSSSVAQVITFNSLLAKGVLRDVARVFGVSYGEADKLAKLIPNKLDITLHEAHKKEPRIEEFLNSKEIYRDVWNVSLELEGLNRNMGVHAAGVVIDNDELWAKTPVCKTPNDDMYVTQYSGKYLEDVNLTKFDFLGLKTLTAINEAILLIKKRYNKDIDFSTIDFNDKGVYELIQSGETLGLFQIESSGMRNLNRRLKPSNFEDLIAVLALYRPGPMDSGMLDDFIDRKHKRAKIKYIFDELEPILETTYGIILYQEQVMQIVQVIGGFSLGRADIVRRAIGKKDKDILDELRDEFIKGAVKNGFNKTKSKEIFNLIEKFGGYGFNKSHSAAYSMITFQTAYLKKYYLKEFMAALLTSEKDNELKIAKYIDELNALNIKVIPPDIKKSSFEFSVVGGRDSNTILFGLGAIKGLGFEAINNIMEVRDGVESLSELIAAVNIRKINKKAIEVLIKSGALDCFGYSRKALMDNIEAIIKANQDSSRFKDMELNSLFKGSNELKIDVINIVDTDEFDNHRLLEFERDTLGFYITSHPLDEFKKEINSIDYTISSEVKDLDYREKIILVGKIEEIKHKISKKGNRFYIFKLLDFHGSLELVAFNDIAKSVENINTNLPYVIEATLSKDDKFQKIRIIKIYSLDDGMRMFSIKNAKKNKITIKTKIENSFPNLNDIHRLATLNVGNIGLDIVLETNSHDVVIKSNLKVNNNFFEKVSKIKEIEILSQ